MFRRVPKGHVRRVCPECSEKNLVEHGQLGTRMRCAGCGSLLYPKEVGVVTGGRAKKPATGETVSRPCPDCEEKNRIDVAHLGTGVRCRGCGSLLFREELRAQTPAPQEAAPRSEPTEVRTEKVVERQVLVTRCKFCQSVTAVDLATCQACGAPKFMD